MSTHTKIARYITATVALTAFAYGAIAADEAKQRWHRTVASVTACGDEEYVLVKPALPSPPNVMYIRAPEATCVKAGAFVGKLSPGDGAVISGTHRDYQIVGRYPE